MGVSAGITAAEFSLIDSENCLLLFKNSLLRRAGGIVMPIKVGQLIRQKKAEYAGLVAKNYVDRLNNSFDFFRTYYAPSGSGATYWLHSRLKFESALSFSDWADSRSS
jgi:hypothetical protein